MPETLSIYHALSPCLTSERAWVRRRRKYYSQPQSLKFSPRQIFIIWPRLAFNNPSFRRVFLGYGISSMEWWKNGNLKHRSPRFEDVTFRGWHCDKLWKVGCCSLMLALSCYRLAFFYPSLQWFSIPTVPLRAHSERSDYSSDVKNRRGKNVTVIQSRVNRSFYFSPALSTLSTILILPFSSQFPLLTHSPPYPYKELAGGD